MKIERKKEAVRFRIVEHNKTVFYWIIALVIVLILVLIATAILEKKKSDEVSQIANPASVYCVDNHGKLEIRSASDGSQYGVCIKNNQECEEWAYFRGECNFSSETCKADLDCVPDDCCHSSSCVNINFTPKCEGISCTTECRKGTSDCLQGSCKCISEKCKLILK